MFINARFQFWTLVAGLRHAWANSHEEEKLNLQIFSLISFSSAALLVLIFGFAVPMLGCLLGLLVFVIPKIRADRGLNKGNLIVVAIPFYWILGTLMVGALKAFVLR